VFRVKFLIVKKFAKTQNMQIYRLVINKVFVFKISSKREKLEKC